MNTEITKNRTTRTIAVDVRIARALREQAAKADGMTIGLLADRLLAEALGLQLGGRTVVTELKKVEDMTPEELDEVYTAIEGL
ncbi:MAG: hypothetical protein JNL21_07315 [Myxococcales bacterium]|nr:hypothetical protein [Myxococcales bacterium]